MNKLRHAFDPREFFYPSNLLTIARILLLPVMLAALRKRDAKVRPLLLVGTLMLTDALDGPIARRRGEVSQLGQLLDPVADKLVLDTTAVTLSQTRGFPWWVTGLLLFRDLGIIAAALLVYRRHATITTAQTSGKLATVGLTLSAMLYIGDGPRSGRPVLYLSLLPFMYSFWQYGTRFISIMWGK